MDDYFCAEENSIGLQNVFEISFEKVKKLVLALIEDRFI
jgi:hypothetical protein